MRREAESELRGEGVEAPADTRVEELEREKAELQRGLAEMVERSNQANLRAEEAAAIRPAQLDSEKSLREAEEEAAARREERESALKRERDEAETRAAALERRVGELESRAEAGERPASVQAAALGKAPVGEPSRGCARSRARPAR